MKRMLKRLFGKEYGSIYYYFKYSFKYDCLFFKEWHQHHNPYYWWWRVRKYWKPPKIHLAHCGKTTWWFGLPVRDDYYNSIIDFRLDGLGWKSKWDSPRYEWDPYFAITLFRKWQIIWIWNYMPHNMKKDDPANDHICSMATWESILWQACFNTNIYKAVEMCGWQTHYKKGEKPKRISNWHHLTQYGREQYYQTPVKVRDKELSEEDREESI